MERPLIFQPAAFKQALTLELFFVNFYPCLGSHKLWFGSNKGSVERLYPDQASKAPVESSQSASTTETTRRNTSQTSNANCPKALQVEKRAQFNTHSSTEIRNWHANHNRTVGEPS